MFLAASYCFVGILMFFHNVLVYVSRLPFQLFRLRVPRASPEPLVCCFVIGFLARGSAATKWRRAMCCAVAIASAFFFCPRMSHASPSSTLHGVYSYRSLDRLCG